jgi:hypothetical protein
MRWPAAVLLAGASFLAAAPAGAAIGRDGDRASIRRALLIGINDYAAVPRLAGSLNDVEAMRRVLVTRWGFDSRNVTVVTDRSATRAGILDALRRLVAEAGADDVVYVHFSGHGSQVEDLDGDEGDDRLDETLVPQDGRTAGVPDITDDEIQAVLASLRSRATLVVLDSCHSGTATRSASVRTRSVPPDGRLELYRRGAASTRGAGTPLARHVLMSGAAANEEALDGPVDGQYRGFFSYALARSLAAASSSASPREVFVAVGRELRRIQTQVGRVSMPQPQLEGPAATLDEPLLGGISVGTSQEGVHRAARVAWVEVQPRTSGSALLAGATLLGAEPGSVWSIYPSAQTDFSPGRAIATATVTSVAGSDAIATVSPGSVRIPPGARAIILMPAPLTGRLSMALLPMPDDLRSRITRIVQSDVRAGEIVSSHAAARYLLEARGGVLRLLSADGLQRVQEFDLEAGQWGAELDRALSRLARAAQLLAIDNPASRLTVSARVASAAAAAAAARDIVQVPRTQTARMRIRQRGESRSADNSLQLEVSVSADAYLTIVDVDTEGNINVLFPNDHQKPGFLPDGRILGGEIALLPDTLVPGGRAGFFWDYGPPAGTDVVRIFASTDLATAGLLRERIRLLRASPADPARPDPAALEIREGLARAMSRGILVVPDDPAASHAPAPTRDWAATTLTITITE